ncbi:MAG: CoA activase, partial [Deltaproteobacteria bacterium]|nr:CoA activase [Deltaproteobacteria bacterium]
PVEPGDGSREGGKGRASFNREIADLIFEGYDGALDPGKKTVGIPRALFTYGMFPMFYTVFKELGFNVLLSEPTHEETIRLGQEYSLDEACYPVKLINGHVAELVEKKVDYIFFPDLYTVDHPGSHTRQNYGCPYMQLAFKVINQAMSLKSRGIELLAPTIAFSLGKAFMMKSFSAMGEQLGCGPERMTAALEKGMKEFYAFEERMTRHGKEVLGRLRDDEPVFVMISKIYGIADPALNMGIPDRLMDMGYRVLGFYDLPEGDISAEHPNMYWPFGQHILEPAKLIATRPNWYAVFLTHHGCGPDSVLSHYFKELMGGKPYLNIEVDEHSSDVGVVTRIEAFVNSLRGAGTARAQGPTSPEVPPVSHAINIKTRLGELKANALLYLPNLRPYAQIFQKMLLRRGVNARVLPETGRRSVDLGRRHTLTNEYFSMTALLGDILLELEGAASCVDNTAFLIPQTEGAEIDGQFHRFVRAKMDQAGFRAAGILAPFLEDVPYGSEETLHAIFLGLLAGDILRTALPEHRDRHQERLLGLLAERDLGIEDLKETAGLIAREARGPRAGKRLLAVGEPMILFNDFMNGFCFREIEKQDHRVLYSPLSEALWVLWRDFQDQNGTKEKGEANGRLDVLKGMIKTLSGCLSDESPFERDPEDLIRIADRTVGYYAGAFGRYREAKLLGGLRGIEGAITVASTYENTAISMNILHRGLENGRPVLHLSFDGNRNENDRTRIESFLYYL